MVRLRVSVSLLNGTADWLLTRSSFRGYNRAMSRRNLFPLLAALSLAAYGGLLWLDRAGGPLRTAVPGTIALFLLAFAAYGAALLWLERGGAWAVGWAWGTAVLARLLLLWTTPSLSDDVYRMIWDGHVALNGISPYAAAVADPALDFLAIPARALVNNPEMASPYLPAAQVVFGLAALIGREPLILQGLMALFDLLAAGVIAALLGLAGLPARRLLLYLWNPLVIIEVAHGAHVDAWMVLLGLLAVWAALARPAGGWLSPLFLALATLTKPLPVLLAPVLFWRWTWGQRLLYPALTAALLLPAGLRAGWGLSREMDGRGLFGALLIYTSRWKFNSGIFTALEALFGGPDSVAATTAAKLLIGAALLAVLLAVFLAARRAEGARAHAAASRRAADGLRAADADVSPLVFAVFAGLRALPAAGRGRGGALVAGGGAVVVAERHGRVFLSGLCEPGGGGGTAVGARLAVGAGVGAGCFGRGLFLAGARQMAACNGCVRSACYTASARIGHKYYIAPAQQRFMHDHNPARPRFLLEAVDLHQF